MFEPGVEAVGHPHHPHVDQQQLQQQQQLAGHHPAAAPVVMMAPSSCQLVSRAAEGPSYCNVSALRSFPNLRLLSNDGFYYELNRCVFAALSPMLTPDGKSPEEQLSDETLDQDLSITTDLRKDELQIVVRYVNLPQSCSDLGFWVDPWDTFLHSGKYQNPSNL